MEGIEIYNRHGFVKKTINVYGYTSRPTTVSRREDDTSSSLSFIINRNAEPKFRKTMCTTLRYLEHPWFQWKQSDRANIVTQQWWVFQSRKNSTMNPVNPLCLQIFCRSTMLSFNKRKYDHAAQTPDGRAPCFSFNSKTSVSEQC